MDLQGEASEYGAKPAAPGQAVGQAVGVIPPRTALAQAQGAPAKRPPAAEEVKGRIADCTARVRVCAARLSAHADSVVGVPSSGESALPAPADESVMGQLLELERAVLVLEGELERIT